MNKLSSLFSFFNRKKDLSQATPADAQANGRLTFEEFSKQMDMMGNLKSLSSLAKYIPGMGALSMTPEMLEKAEVEMKKWKTIINAMTPEERKGINPLDASSKHRIAREANVSVADINSLITRFEQSQQMMKTLKYAKR